LNVSWRASRAGWTWEPRRARQQENIERLEAFVAKYGWKAVSEALVVDDIRLGDWVSGCQMRYRAGGLSEETVTGLEAIPGWSWTGRTSWYQPRDAKNRFVPMSERERRRQRNASSRVK
jgi:hypothetical protein